MTRFHVSLAAGLVAASLAAAAPAFASQDAPPPSSAEDLSHLHDFDFLFGDWRVHHRRLKDRLVGDHAWITFDGSCSARPLMDGRGNVDDNMLDMPSGAYRAIGLRSYDAKTAQWAIWWLDGRSPHADLDPPVKGRFENGIGTFYADDTLRGKPIRVRFTWSKITSTSAHWEQAFSADAGKTWEVNWTMEFERAG